jgi:hypothetical protein
VATSSAVLKCESATTHGLATLLYTALVINWPEANCSAATLVYCLRKHVKIIRLFMTVTMDPILQLYQTKRTLYEDSNKHPLLAVDEFITLLGRVELIYSQVYESTRVMVFK